VAFECFPVIFSKTVYAVACRHIPVIGTPEGKSIDQRFAQDDLFRDGERLFIPDAFVRARKVSMQRRALAQSFGDFPAIDFRNGSIQINHRNHNRSGEVFVPAFPQDAKPLQSSPDLRALFPIAFRQAVAERSIRKAQPKVVDHFRMLQASVLQVSQSFRALLQGCVVIIRYFLQHPGIIDACFEWRFDLHRRGGSTAADNRTRRS